MPLQTVIDNFVLAEAADGEDRYLFLLDPATGEFLGAAGYFASRRYFECVDLVSDGYGPTLFLLLMQKAKRDGARGVAPDLSTNSAEAKRMDARLYHDPPPGVAHVPNADAKHPEVFLNQIYFLTADVIAEVSARRNAERYFLTHPLGSVVPRVKQYLLRAMPPADGTPGLAQDLLGTQPKC